MFGSTDISTLPPHQGRCSYDTPCMSQIHLTKVASHLAFEDHCFSATEDRKSWGLGIERSGFHSSCTYLSRDLEQSASPP